MRRIRACAAVAACLIAMFLLSACTTNEELPPQPTPFFAPPAPPPLAPRAEPSTPNQVANEIVHWFTTAGYQRFQADALADHARIESGFRPCAAGPGGYHYTFQWAGTRLQQLHEFAHDPGCPRLDSQLAFANTELRNDPKFACFWDATSRTSALSALRRGFGGGSC